MAQFLRTNADTVVGGWRDEAAGVTDIFNSIDEVTQSDTDFIESPNNPVDTEIYEAALSAGSTPDAGTRTVRYTYGKNGVGGRTIQQDVELREGTTRIHLWTHTDVPNGFTLQTQTVTGSITNYANLNMRTWGTTTGSGAGRRANKSWWEFEIPNAPAGGLGMPLVMHHRKQMAGNN